MHRLYLENSNIQRPMLLNQTKIWNKIYSSIFRVGFSNFIQIHTQGAYRVVSFSHNQKLSTYIYSIVDSESGGFGLVYVPTSIWSNEIIILGSGFQTTKDPLPLSSTNTSIIIMFQLPKNISEERLCFNAKNCSVKDVIHSAYFQNQFNQFVAEEHGESCINCSISTTSIIVFLCINACLMIFIFLWAIKGNNSNNK